MRLINADCVDALRDIAENSIDAIVTDPPYGLEFMGKDWDSFTGAGMTKPGIGDRQTAWPSFTGTNKTRCAHCGMLIGQGGSACRCDTPKPYNAALPRLHAFQVWCEEWAIAAYRVLKPGGHLLAFGGTRTYHRLACAIEDAGFEIRDSIHWVYGSGFPKSLDVSKAIDKTGGESLAWFIDYCLAVADQRGLKRKDLTALFPSKNGNPTGWLYNKASHSQSLTVEQFNALRDFLDLPFGTLEEAKREVVGRKAAGMGSGDTFGMRQDGGNASAAKTVPITAPATDNAARWQGWGTALKPAHEPIVVARKPLAGTVAQTVLAHGTGALNIDGCRVGTDGGTTRSEQAAYPLNADGTEDRSQSWARTGHAIAAISAGRWPPNFLLTHAEGCEEGVCVEGCPVREMDAQSGTSTSRVGKPRGTSKKGLFANSEFNKVGTEHNDTGGASRFFPTFRYQAKASRRERGEGNTHPTVKPVELMRWLCRLVTPPGGVVLDPFTGSGTTGVAAVLEGFDFIGIEREPEYIQIAERRIQHASQNAKSA